MKQNFLFLPEHLWSPMIFWRGSCCSVLSFVCSVHASFFVCLVGISCFFQVSRFECFIFIICLFLNNKTYSTSTNIFHFRYWKCDIKGAAKGKLAGKTIGIKDNVAVAGVPMMNGSKILEGYTPEFDATIITRILDEGTLSIFLVITDFAYQKYIH